MECGFVNFRFSAEWPEKALVVSAPLKRYHLSKDHLLFVIWILYEIWSTIILYKVVFSKQFRVYARNLKSAKNFKFFSMQQTCYSELAPQNLYVGNKLCKFITETAAVLNTF